MLSQTTYYSGNTPVNLFVTNDSWTVGTRDQFHDMGVSIVNWERGRVYRTRIPGPSIYPYGDFRIC